MGMIDLKKIFDNAIEPYLEAESGDWRKFADMIERGEPLHESARKIIAEHLRGNSPTPKRRKRQQEKTEAEICYLVFDQMEKGLSKYAAINKVSEIKKMEPETIKTYLRNWRTAWKKIEQNQ